ncbi:LysR family transcriptional regulator [Gayadomonas joobiniege]|uniref:LysR family transcriptional regulator n=1 Tax=Gayadomonas joobiniege TaxID=1234606 RepID=UPI00036D812B|nr:LysR family transcriptional regulator [Gayadomonas joobiniege]
MKISDLQVLLKIAEQASITAAAHQLDMSSSAASMALKRIEQALGAQMFVRTTRQLRLTPEGERYLPLCQQAVALLQEGQTLVLEKNQAINGEIKMALSSEMGRNLMRELLNDILAEYPQVSLRLHVSDSRADFYRDGVDIALRAMTQETVKNLNLHGFKICNIPHFLCASPSYIKKHGEPKKPDDLSHHNALLYKLYDVVHDVWKFERDGQIYKSKVSSNRAVNDGDIVRRWCIDGVGIAKKSVIDISQDLLSGKLQRVMPDYKIPLTEMWLVLPSRQLISPTVRLIKDQLIKTIAQRRSQLFDAGLITPKQWPE